MGDIKRDQNVTMLFLSCFRVYFCFNFVKQINFFPWTVDEGKHEILEKKHKTVDGVPD